jgi:creatinine amidohydrolase
VRIRVCRSRLRQRTPDFPTINEPRRVRREAEKTGVSMLLHLSTWAEIEQYLKRSRAVVVPIGSNEQHGPTGLLGTDWLCPEIIAREAEKSADILVAPTFNIGMAQHHLGFPGTISLRPSTFIAAIGDWIRSLATHGFEKILFLNGHGGNVASIEAAFSEVYVEASFAKRHAGFAMKLCNWWDLEGVGELARKQFPEGHGVHATPSEIAITQWAFPDAIKSADYSPKIAPSGPIREALDFRARYPDGRMGSDPAQASPEKGGELVRLAASSLVRELNAFASEPLPR